MEESALPTVGGINFNNNAQLFYSRRIGRAPQLDDPATPLYGLSAGDQRGRSARLLGSS